MRNPANSPKSLGMAVLLTFIGVGAAVAASPETFCRIAVTTGEGDVPSNDGTETPNPGRGGDAGDEGSSEDETPGAREPEEPGFGGCIFDKKPLQLMV